MPRHEKTLTEQYQPYIVGFMQFRDGVNYAKDNTFTQQQLGAIQPEEIVRWMQLKVHGTPNPGPDDNDHGRFHIPHRRLGHPPNPGAH